MRVRPTRRAQYEGVLHQWGCPGCGTVNSETFDPRGLEVECLRCDTASRVES